MSTQARMPDVRANESIARGTDLVPAGAEVRFRQARVWLGLGLLLCLIWSYWATIAELVAFWQRNQDYSVGMLVPFVAVWLVWRDRASLAEDPVRPCWWGLLVLGMAEAVRLGGVFFGFGSGERYALVLCVAGTTLLAAGWRIFWRLKWVLLFLVLMIPLPARLHEIVALPLQNLATGSAVFGLELLGFFVLREGNVLRLNSGETVAVAEACSGLRMLTAFIFVAAVLAFLVRRPAWQKVILLAFSIPVAMLSNSLRVIATSIFANYFGASASTAAFHDASGIAMMPLAIVLSVGLLKFMNYLSAPEAAYQNPVPPGRGRMVCGVNKESPRTPDL
jgi:exosortase